MNNEQLKYWHTYLESIESNGEDFYVEASIAGNESISDELLKLYLDGKKTAGSGLVKDYTLAGDELPKVGNHWVVLDSELIPKCILKTTKVEINKFSDITQEIASAEGEGDLSIEYWKDAHRKFFSPYLKGWGINDLSQEDVVTEFYSLVFRCN